MEALEELFRKYCWNQIQEILVSGRSMLELDWGDLSRHDLELAQKLLDSPEKILDELEQSLNQILRSQDPEFNRWIKLGIKGLPVKYRIRQIRTCHLNKLLGVSGLVRMVGEIRPRLKIAVYRCESCGELIKHEQPVFDQKPPESCRCGVKSKLKLSQEESEFTDFQLIKLQESPEELEGGEQPQMLDVLLEGNLAGILNPGDRVVVNGILKFASKPRAGVERYLEAIWVELERPLEQIQISPEEESKILQLRDRIQSRICDYIAPSIYGYEHIKKAISLQLFGGVPKQLQDGTKIRGDIHVLLVGDPGTGKCISGDSRLLLPDGTYLRIRELDELLDSSHGSDPQLKLLNHGVISLDSSGRIRLGRAVALKKLRARGLLNVVTESGRQILVTQDHRFLSPRNGFILPVPASQLRPGDLIAVPGLIQVEETDELHVNINRGRTNAYRIKIPSKLSPELSRFLGYLISSGYTYFNGDSCFILFRSEYPQLRQDFKHCCREVFGIEPKKPPTRPETELWISSVELWRFLRSLDSNLGNSKQFPRRIPRIIFRAPMHICREFIRACFDCAGVVDEYSNQLALFSVDREFLEQMGLLLRRFRILCRYLSKGQNFHLLIVEHPQLFAELIGLGLESKSQKLGRILANPAPTKPVFEREYKSLCSRLGIKPEFKDDFQALKLLRSHLESHPDPELESYLERLQRLLSCDVYWDRIKKLTPVPGEHWVYDIQVEEFRNFVANDLIVHNSQLLKYASQLSPRAIYTSGRGATAAGLCVSGDSEIMLLDGCIRIKRLVERNLQNWKKLGSGIIFSPGLDHPITISWDEDDFRIKPARILGYWKLRSPQHIVRISTQSGRSLELSPWTPIPVLGDGGVISVAASKLLPDQLILTVEDSGKLCWDRIQTKEIRASDHDFLYDLSLDSPNWFVANGIVVHNTATVVKDEAGNGRWVLEAGALVLADGGLCCVDEIEKMRNEDRIALHEAMEQQTVSVAKAGVTATLKARTALLAAANPKYGRFDMTQPISDQIDLPPVLLSRFDLIFVLLDQPGTKLDQEITKHILESHRTGGAQAAPDITREMLRKYIAYAKKINPVLSSGAIAKIQEFYSGLRSLQSPDSPIPVTRRALESLIRLTEAHARMRLSTIADENDAQEAIQIYLESLKQCGVDPFTGKMDADLYLGCPKSLRESISKLKSIINELTQLNGFAALDLIHQRARESGIPPEKIFKALEFLRQRGEVYEVYPERFKLRS